MQLLIFRVLSIFVFSVFNLFLLRTLSSLFENKDIKLIKSKYITITILNTIIGYSLYFLGMDVFYIYLSFILVIFIECKILFSSMFYQTLFCSSILFLVNYSIYNIIFNLLYFSKVFQDKELIITISQMLSFIICILIIVFKMKNFNSKDFDIFCANRLQMNISIMISVILVILTSVVSLIHLLLDYNQVISVIILVLSAVTIFIIYGIINYGIKLSIDIWEQARLNIDERSDNTEFDLDMYKSIDVLTGLYNKEYGFVKIQEFIDNGEQVTLVFINVNQYANVKQKCGQGLANDYIKVVANSLSSTYRDNDIIFRLDESRFIVILLNCPVNAADKTTSRAYNKVRQYSNKLKSPVTMSISFGCEMFDRNTDVTISDIIDISISKKSEFNLKKNEIMDELTGIYNKKFALNLLEDMCYKNDNFSILIFQVNQVYSIINMYGENEYHKLLEILANLCVGVLDYNNSIARVSDNQFMVILSDSDEENVLEVWNFIYTEILAKFQSLNKPYGLDLSHYTSSFKADDNLMPSELFSLTEEKLEDLLHSAQAK